MNKKEFEKKWMELLDKQYKRVMAQYSYQLMATEAKDLGDQVWELIIAYESIEADDLALIMLKTCGKKDSFQEWAKAILQRIKTGIL